MGGRTIEALLTAGTLTTTYAAVNDAGDKQVLRVLHPELSESMAERFAELLAQAPDVAPEDTAPPLEVGSEGDRHFAVGPLLSGESVAALVARRPGKLAPRECLRICHAIAEVLARAHAQGTLHGALHPGHVFLMDDGSVKLLDFGFVGLRAEAARVRRLGWPRWVAFAAPETELGTALVDAAADVWSLGALAFFLLTGLPPYDGRTELELAASARARRPISLAEIAPRAPLVLTELVDRFLLVASHERYSDARTALAALSSVAEHAEVATLLPLAAELSTISRASPLAATVPAAAASEAPPLIRLPNSVKPPSERGLFSAEGAPPVSARPSKWWDAAAPELSALIREELSRVSALARFDTSFQLEDCWAAAQGAETDPLGTAADVLDPNVPMLSLLGRELAQPMEPARLSCVAAAALSDETTRGDLELTAAPMRRTVGELSGTDPERALDVTALLLRSLVGTDEELPELERIAANAVVSARALSSLLAASIRSRWSEAALEQLTRLVELLDAEHAAALATALPELTDPALQARVVHQLEFGMSGHEAALGALVAQNEPRSALVMLRLLSRIDTLAAQEAVARGFENPHVVVRIEALGQLEGLSGERLRKELAAVLDGEPSSVARIRTLREIQGHEVRAAGPFIALRIKSAGFSNLSFEERRQSLNTLGTLMPARAETLALEILRKDKLITLGSHQETRMLAADLLGRIATSDEALEVLEQLSRKRWGSNQELRDAARRAVEQFHRRRESE